MLPANNLENNSYLNGLNTEQLDAVTTTEGPLLVLAGAGTGKTRALITRLVHILNSNLAFPGEILAVTFTNKAAQEMRERVSKITNDPSVNHWWIGTFHSIAVRILRQNAPLVGLTSNFTILDSDDQKRLIKQILEDKNIDTKKHPPKILGGVIQRWKDKALLPENIQKADAISYADGKMLEIYQEYQNRLKQLNACDFGDLLLHVLNMLKKPENLHILQKYQNQFKYIMVDEYQDTNSVQYLWLRLLAQSHKNICCVGDDDQSIYGWRGAEIENILRFEKDFPGAKTIKLEQNYRSTTHILSAANAVIQNNPNRLGKNLWSEIESDEKVQCHGVWDAITEARDIAEEIEQLQRKKHLLSDIAILVRAGFQTREFEERFITLGIPYKIIGGARFYERLEIRDALAYFRIIAQGNDDLAFERIVNTPKRGIGKATIKLLYKYARENGLSLLNSIRENPYLKGKVKNTLMDLLINIENWRESLNTEDHPVVAKRVLEESGYNEMWKKEKTPDAQGRVENLKELVTAIAEFDNIYEFLEHISLVMENSQRSDTDMVNIMTLHGAKGLEFETVFLPGWEEGLFPSQRSIDENGLAGLEEERRLAYVGITRAKQKAYIYYAANRQIFGSWITSIPSRFVNELPDEHVEKNTTNNGMGGNSGRNINLDKLRFTDRPTISSDNGFKKGDRIIHAKFGEGVVLSVDQDKLDIQFSTSGRKKLVDRFVKPV